MPTVSARPSRRPVNPMPMLYQTLTEISLLRLPQYLTGWLNTAVTSTTSRFNQTPVYFRLIPHQKRTTEMAEVGEAMRSLRAEKYSGVDKVPSEPI
ncbi:hypothetical protein DPMN_013032 [Dreissena polymorpha]|uniref:Uncharacterized protein n=1 Tax=Dreissena polymorpha TaxID=45954 RepID=A0A9D4N6Z7_DREPO|nr:hypothetical protein DPMN_013032 [Dreissena polymorpha]